MSKKMRMERVEPVVVARPSLASQVHEWADKNIEKTADGRCPMCGYPKPPLSHYCLEMPLLSRLFKFAYTDGPFLYLVSRIDDSYLLRADIGNGTDYPSDEVLCTLAGVRKPDDLLTHDMGKGRLAKVQRIMPSHEEAWDMLRAIRDMDDFDALRGITEMWRDRWEDIPGIFETWDFQRVLKDTPPLWRRVALGDDTIAIDEKLPKFRGVDPFRVGEDNVVGYGHAHGGKVEPTLSAAEKNKARINSWVDAQLAARGVKL